MSKYRYETGGIIRDLELDIPYRTDDIVDLLTGKDLHIAELQKQLKEKEKETKHWHNLYQERDKQFQSVRQRYHLLNKLQSNYDKKDKLHLLEMQCFDLVKENEELKKQLAITEKEFDEYRKDAIKSYNSFSDERFNLKSENIQLEQQLKNQPAEIVEKIKAYYETSIYDRPEAHTKVKVLFSRLDTILEEYQK